MVARIGGSAPRVAALVLTVLVISQSLVTASDTCPKDKYCVRRQTTNRLCRVQAGTEAPLGADFKGPFNTKADARKAMCDSYDETVSDPDKCWAVYPEDACKSRPQPKEKK